MAEQAITRKQLIDRLNEDLSREYQAIIAYVVYSQVLKGAEYMNIAKELEKHAEEELQHAMKLSKHIDYLGGMPTATAKPVKLSEKAEERRAEAVAKEQAMRAVTKENRAHVVLAEAEIPKAMADAFRKGALRLNGDKRH